MRKTYLGYQCKYCKCLPQTGRVLAPQWRRPVSAKTNEVSNGEYRDAITLTLENSCTSFPQIHSTLPENLQIEIADSESRFSSPPITLDGSVVNFFSYSATVPQDLETGEYIFRLLSSGLPVSNTVSSEITCERAIEDIHLNIANVFTPNGDGINDSFAPEYEGDFLGSLRIYNRLGREIFYTGEVKLGWSGNNAESGMYYYAITLAQKKYSGWVHLLK